MRLAAELESDQLLLNALSEINLDEPFYAAALEMKTVLGKRLGRRV